MAELLTAAQLRERLDLEKAEFDRLQRARLWPKAKDKGVEKYPWPDALHAFVKERERRARAELPEFVSGEQLGELVNRTARTLFNYQKAGIPHNAEGKAVRYPTALAVQWCITHFLQEAKAGGDDGKEPSLAKQKELEDLLKARANRIQAEFDLAKDQGRLLTVDFVAGQWEELCGAVMAVIQNVPGDISDRLVGLNSVQKARAIVRQALDPAVLAIRASLQEVAQRVATVPDESLALDVDDAEDDDAARDAS